MAAPSPIVLLTDFGMQDAYVGMMKGVISGIAPQANLIDLTHAIPPGDIHQAAYMLWQAHDAFPAGSIFLVVVDPGVGTQRQGIVMKTHQQIFVGPDNGVFSLLMQPSQQTWELDNPALQYAAPSVTFHGRDIFAPAAGHIANGVLLEDFGAPIANPIRLPAPLLNFQQNGDLQGEILHIDRFGNLITSLGQFQSENYRILWTPWQGTHSPRKNLPNFDWLETPGGRHLRFVNTFADLQKTECGFLIGSSGLLEIVANRQSAAKILSLSTGESVTLHFKNSRQLSHTS